MQRNAQTAEAVVGQGAVSGPGLWVEQAGHGTGGRRRTEQEDSDAAVFGRGKPAACPLCQVYLPNAHQFRDHRRN